MTTMNVQAITDGMQVNPQPDLRWLLHAEIAPSALNPRKTFDAEKLEELAKSMREHGFLCSFPLVVRPLGGGGDKPELGGDRPPLEQANFEIVMGERRWRAAELAGLACVFCEVRALDDVQALTLALLENLQREDLNPLEEAEGYSQLLEMRHDGGEPVHTVDSIAQRLGRTYRHVRQLLSLLRLRGTQAEGALKKGEMPATVAREIAKLPTAELREEVAEKVLHNPYGESPMPRRELLQLLQDEYMRDLRGMLFKTSDASLVPVKLAEDGTRLYGGACTDCPYNSKNSAGAGEKGKGHLTCLHVTCFRLKEEADYERWRAGVKGDRSTQTFPKPDNDKLWGENGVTLSPYCGLLELSDPPASVDLRTDADEAEVRPWRELIGKQKLTVIFARDKAGKTRELAFRNVVLEACREEGVTILREVSRPRQATPEQQAARAERDAAEERARLIAERLEKQVNEAILGTDVLKLPNAFWNVVTAGMVEAVLNMEPEALEKFAEQLGWDAEAEEETADMFLNDFLAGVGVPQKLVYMHAMGLRLLPGSQEPEALEETGLALGVDPKAVRKAIDAELAEAAKNQAKAAKLAEGLEWLSKRDKVEEFAISETGVFTAPDQCNVHFPKSSKVIASVAVGRSAKGWHVAWAMNAGKSGGISLPCANTSESYSSRELALRTGLLGIRDALKDVNAGEKALALAEEYIALVEGGFASR